MSGRVAFLLLLAILVRKSESPRSMGSFPLERRARKKLSLLLPPSLERAEKVAFLQGGKEREGRTVPPLTPSVCKCSRHLEP